MKKAMRLLLFLFLMISWIPSIASAQGLSVQPWPANGRLCENALYPGQQTELDIYIQNQTPGYASLIKLCTPEGDTVRCLFAGSSSDDLTKFQIYMQFPGGKYIVKLGIGQTWYGLEGAFGSKGIYRTLLLDGDNALIALDDGFTYVLYLDTSLDAGSSNDFAMEAIPYEAF